MWFRWRPYTPDRLEAQVKAKLPSNVPAFCVPVAAIPLTASGDVDEKALLQLPVVDESLLQLWEKQMQARSDVRQAAVIVQEHSGEQPPLHLSDLIPNWKSAAASRASELAPVTPVFAVGAKELEPRPLAYSDGGPLTIPEDAPKTFTEALLRTAKAMSPQGIASRPRQRRRILSELSGIAEQAKRILAGLQAKGLGRGLARDSCNAS